MKNNIVRLLLSCTVIAGMGLYISNSPEIYRLLKEVRFEFVFILAALNLLFFLSNALILKSLLRAFDISMTVKECLGVSVVASIGNSLTSLGGGTMGKALYLKRKYNLNYSTFLSSVSATSLMSLFIVSIAGGGAILVIGLKSNVLLRILFWLFFLFSTIFCFVFFLSYEPGGHKNKIYNMMVDVVRGWNLIRRDRLLIIKISFLLFTNYLLSMADLMLSYRAFSIDIGISQAFLMVAIFMFSGMIKIVPAGLGIYEGSIALSSQLLGMGFGQGLLAAGFSRIVSIIVLLTLGVIFGPRLLKERGKSKPARGASLG